MGCGGSPQLPNYGQMAADAVQANLATYPTTYKVNAAASLGQPVTIDGQTYNFTGLGDATTAGVVSDQMAQALLDIQKNYSPDFIKQRLAELQTADPEGYAARQQLFDQILQQADQQPDRPLASDLQNQITNLLNASGQLDARQLQEVQQNVRGGQVGRGNYLGNAATEQEAAGVVQAGQQAQDANQQAALQYLQSGVSPQDVAYRRLQQSLGNLSNFVQGATPTAEFASLSGAQNGAAPTTTLSQNPTQINTQAAAQGANNALAIYGGQINWAQNQVNPYTAGLSTAASALGAAGAMGWNPFGTSSPTGLTPAEIQVGNTAPNYNPGQVSDGSLG